MFLLNKIVSAKQPLLIFLPNHWNPLSKRMGIVAIRSFPPSPAEHATRPAVFPSRSFRLWRSACLVLPSRSSCLLQSALPYFFSVFPALFPGAIVQTGAEIFSASFSSSPDYHIFPMMTAGNFLSSLPFSMLSPLQISFSTHSFSLLFSGSTFLFSYTQLRISSISSVFSDISSSLSSVVSVCCSIQSLLLFSLSFSPFSQTELLSAVI